MLLCLSGGAGYATTALLARRAPDQFDRAWAATWLVVALALGLWAVCYTALLRWTGGLSMRRAWSVSAFTLLPWLLAWPFLAILARSDYVNHWFVFAPRLRMLVSLTVAVPVLVAQTALLLWHYDAARGTLTRFGAWLGEARLVGGLFLIVYLASAGGHLYTPDEATIYATARSLVEYGSLAIRHDDPYPLNHLAVRATVVRDAEGNYLYGFSKYGVVPALLSAPFYAVARLAGPPVDGPSAAFPYESRALPLVPLLFGPAVSAATAALLYAFGRRLGYSPVPCLAAAAGWGLASHAWPMAKTMLNGPPAALFVLASLYLLRSRAGTRSSCLAAAAAGTAYGLGVATRYELLLFAPIVAGYAAWTASRQGARTRALRAAPRALLAFGLPLVVVALVAVGAVNLAKTGSPWDTGYGSQATLSSLDPKPYYGLLGILLSPGFGLVVYAPPLALGALALAWLWEDDRALAAVVGLLALGAWLLYGSVEAWNGTTWGPRYLLVIGPLLALPLAAWLQRMRRNPIGLLWYVLTLAAGISVNSLAVLFDVERAWQDHWTLGADLHRIIWLPFFSNLTALVRVARLWLLYGQGGLDLYLYAKLGLLIPLLAALTITGLVVCWARLPVQRQGHPSASQQV